MSYQLYFLILKKIEELRDIIQPPINRMFEKRANSDDFQKKKENEHTPIVDVLPTNPGRYVYLLWQISLKPYLTKTLY